MHQTETSECTLIKISLISLAFTIWYNKNKRKCHDGQLSSARTLARNVLPAAKDGSSHIPDILFCMTTGRGEASSIFMSMAEIYNVKNVFMVKIVR